jgi:glycosyltransferase involved in cell wall biosynthesis
MLGAVSDAELVEQYARCRAVYFAPWNEDYGFVTQEAFRSGKAVITTDDSGGPAELVRDGENGLVGPSTPEAVGRHLDALAADRGRAERMGQTAARDAALHTWARAVEVLARPL